MRGSRWTPELCRNMVYQVTPSPRAAAYPGHGRIRGAARSREAGQRTGRIAVKPAPFAYHRADGVEQAISLLAGLGEEAKILAGGQSLVPMMNLRLARPSALVDVTRIPGLSYLRVAADGLHIGALTPHRAIETTRDPAVTPGVRGLPPSARGVRHYPVPGPR